MKAVIIEDEILASQTLQDLIREINPDIFITTVLQSIEESVEWFRNNEPPDLLFLDIHLADGSSFSIFNQVRINCPVIFTTAYDEYALKAFEVNSIDYLLKPINKKELQRALDKYSNMVSNRFYTPDSLQQLLAGMKSGKPAYKTYFLVPERDKLIPLSVKDIAYVYIDNKLVKAVTFDNKINYLEQTLDTLMENLDPQLFFRANRQFIISHAAVKDISLWFGSKLSVNLTVPTPERILVSKARVREFKQWFSSR